MDVRIFPPEEMIMATVSLPLSKSISNRIITINALTSGGTLPILAECDDVNALLRAIDAIKVKAWKVDIGAAGTAMRFATALIAATEGTDIVIDGSKRMRARPMKTLIDALLSLGANITCTENDGHAPLHIRGCRLKGGEITVDAGVSSQFISALMMIAPTMEQGLTISLDGEIVSMPYIRMTAALMRRAGVAVDIDPYKVTIHPGQYKPVDWHVEPDWSAASYWYSIAAISAGFVTIEGLKLQSIQGDAMTRPYFERLGVITTQSDEVDDALELSASPEQFSRFEEDLSQTPDIAQSIAVTCAMLGIPFHLRGLQSLRLKETDRLEALRTELDRLGIVVELRGNSEIVWNLERHPIFEPPVIETYDDHRMAMAFAPCSIFIPGIVIRDCEVVSKSYPTFWDDLRCAGFIITDASEPLPEPEEEGEE